ncbi:MAG: hypothetical protein HYT22_03185 [Candidatus Niyogibacteria bacterium]|nr:hypothetical protein [Candidatus Niyogibacteria bacterium]
MKPVFALIVLAGFTGIAIFGFMGMDHAQSGGHGDCIASAALGACQDLTRADLVFLHISAFQSFSEAVVNGAAGIGWFLALFATALAASIVLLFLPEHPRNFWRQLESGFLRFKEEFLRWLALHENSPSFAGGAGV